jgi:hypothetical protein
MEAAVSSVPSDPAAAVLIDCEPMPEGTPVIRGYDFANGDGDGGHLQGVMDAMLCTGFQVTTKAERELGRVGSCLSTGHHTTAQLTAALSPRQSRAARRLHRSPCLRGKQAGRRHATALTVLCRVTGDELRQSLPAG